MAATIKDIAQKAGVSAATVSKVLNRKDKFIGEQTRARIWSLARELNYIPNSIARSLVTKRSFVVGIIVPDILNPYFAELVRACDDAARHRGYATILCNSDGDRGKEASHLTFLAGHGVDGIILAASDVETDVGVLGGLGVPFVSMDREIPQHHNHVGSVDTDYEAGAFIAATHLLGKGHTRIGFLSGSAESANTRTRLAGFERAHREAGLSIDTSLVRCGEFQHRFGLEAALSLLDQAQFTGLCCMSDMLAIGAATALRGRGVRIPEDCAVVGFDNTYLASLLERPLSTIDRCTADAARLAVDALVDALEAPVRLHRNIVIEPSLVQRMTS